MPPWTPWRRRGGLGAFSARQERAGVAFYSYAVTNKDGVPPADFCRALTEDSPDGVRPVFPAWSGRR